VCDGSLKPFTWDQYSCEHPHFTGELFIAIRVALCAGLVTSQDDVLYLLAVVHVALPWKVMLFIRPG
jgi:hypothetical protein